MVPFFPMQFIHEGRAKQCLTSGFKTRKLLALLVRLFKDVVFSTAEKMKKELEYPVEQPCLLFI